MTQPSLTINDALSIYEAQGIDDAEAVRRMSARGVNIMALEPGGGSKKIKMTVGEFLDLNQGTDPVKTRGDLVRRGIFNVGRFTEEQFEKDLPAYRTDINLADKAILEDYEKEFQAGDYDEWLWESDAKNQRERAVRAVIEQQTGVSYNKVEEHLKDPNFFALTEGASEDPNRAYAARLRGARTELNQWKYEAERAGFAVSASAYVADMMGVKPGTNSARLVMESFTQKSDIAKEGLFKDTPSGKALLKATSLRKRELVDRLNDIFKNKHEPVSMDRQSIESAYGEVAPDGRIKKKGYIRGADAIEKKLINDLRQTMKVERRLDKERTYKSLEQWLDASLEDGSRDFTFRLDTENQARLARAELNKKFRKTLKAHPGIWRRGADEFLEIMSGLYGMTTYMVGPAGDSGIENIADLVASGKLDKHEARIMIDQEGLKKGGSVMGGLAAYVMAFGNWDEFVLQAKAEPLSAILGALPAFTLLKAARVGSAGKAYKRLVKMAKEMGATDDMILEASEFSSKLASKKEKGMLRDWLDTARGKHAQSKFLAGLDYIGAPEVIAGAVKFAAPAIALGGEGDVLFSAAIGGAIGGVKGAIKPHGILGAKFMRIMDDITAQSTPSGQVVTEQMQALIEGAEGLVSALKAEFENARGRGEDVKLEDFGLKVETTAEGEKVVIAESAIDATAATEFLGRKLAAVDNSEEVLAARYLYEDLRSRGILGEELIEARKNLLRTKREAMVRFVEGDGTPDNPGAMFIVNSNYAQSKQITQLTKARVEQSAAAAAEIENLKKEKAAALEEADTKAFPETEEAVVRANEELEHAHANQLADVERAKKNEARDLERVEVRKQNEIKNLDEALEGRRGKRAVGRSASRKEVLRQATTALEKAKKVSAAAKKEITKRWRAILRVKRANVKKLGRTLTENAKVRHRRAFEKTTEYRALHEPSENALKKAQDAFDKAEDQYRDPGVIIKGEKVSFVQARLAIDERASTRTRAAQDKARVDSSARSDEVLKATARLDEVAAQRRQLLERELNPDAPRPDPLEVSRAEIETAYDKDIAGVEAREAGLMAEAAAITDRIVRAKAAEYNRAYNTAFGLHVNDGDYVLGIDSPVIFNKRSGRLLSIDENSEMFKDTPYVKMSNGLTGTSRNATLSTGNILARAMAFPSANIAPIMKALNGIVDFASEGMTATAKSGATRKQRKAGDAAPEVSPVVTDGTKKQADVDALQKAVDALEAKGRGTEWSQKAIDAITGGDLNDRGVNDLRRILLEVYGDILANETTRRVLVEPRARGEFVEFAKKKIISRMGMTKRLDKKQLNQMNVDLGGMALDFAQGRTIDEWATYARVSYSILDEDGNLVRFVTGNGDEVPLTMDNLFREWSEANSGSRMLARSRKQALTDTLYFTARAAEGRMVADEAILRATGVTREIWERGGRDPLYIQSIFKYFLRTGDLPPAFRVAKDAKTNALITSPTDIKGGIAEKVLESLIDTDANQLGLTMVEAADRINDQLFRANQPGKRDLDYVRIGSAEDPSQLPGVTSIGASPYEPGKIGLHSIHAPVQPEHLGDLLGTVRSSVGSPGGTDILIRREMADSMGYMLDTHRTLQTESKIFTNLRAYNAYFKWGKTAGSLLNPLTNFASNIKTYMINQGLDPGRAWAQPIYTAMLWSEYRKGRLEGTTLGGRLEELTRTGFTEQSQLVVEVDKSLLALRASGEDTSWVQPLSDLFMGGKIPGTKKRIPGIAEITELQHRLYRQFGDELFKVTDALREWDKIDARIKEMPKGSTIGFTNLDTGAGFADAKMLGTITRTDEGYAVVMKSGRDKGKVIHVDSIEDAAAKGLIAKAAMGHANSLYYNLAKGGAGIRHARQLESIFVRPFQSWRLKALDIPMLKKGMFHRMFVDDIYMVSDSNKVNMMLYTELASRQARRALWLQVAKQTQTAEDTNAIRGFFPHWARRAILSGTGAERSFFLAESSNPIGGIMTFAELISDIDDLVNPETGERSFWNSVRGESAHLPSIQGALKDTFSGGSVTQLLYAAMGWNDLREDYVKTSDEYWAAVAKMIAPNWYLRVGAADPFINKTGSIPRRIQEETAALVDFLPNKLGKRSSIPLLRTGEPEGGLVRTPVNEFLGDAGVSMVNAVLARKYRKADPIWLTNVAVGFPDKIYKQIIKIAEENILKGIPADSEKTQRQIQPLLNSMKAYERHVPRMVEALAGNGFDSRSFKNLQEKVEAMKKKWKKRETP